MTAYQSTNGKKNSVKVSDPEKGTKWAHISNHLRAEKLQLSNVPLYRIVSLLYSIHSGSSVDEISNEGRPESFLHTAVTEITDPRRRT